MIKRQKDDTNLTFYQCQVCGNLIIKLEDSGISPQCCGRDMMELEPLREESMMEKHMPVWKIIDGRLVIQVGDDPHPMSKEHYIRWIAVKTNKGIHIRQFTSDDYPEAVLNLGSTEEIQEIYSFCNLHGLWKAEKPT